MATDGHESHEELMKLTEDLSDACGSVQNEDRCDQAIEFDKCIEKEVKAKNAKIPFI